MLASFVQGSVAGKTPVRLTLPDRPKSFSRGSARGFNHDTGKAGPPNKLPAKSSLWACRSKPGSGGQEPTSACSCACMPPAKQKLKVCLSGRTHAPQIVPIGPAECHKNGCQLAAGAGHTRSDNTHIGCRIRSPRFCAQRCEADVRQMLADR